MLSSICATDPQAEKKRKTTEAVKTLPTSIEAKEGKRAPPPGKKNERTSSEDLKGGKPPPAPDQDLGSNWSFQERAWCRVRL